MHSEQTTTTYSSPVSAAQGGGPKKEVMLWQTPKCCTRSLTLTEQPTLVGGGPSLQLVLTAPDAQDFSPCLCETLGCVHKTTTFAVPGNAAPVHAQPAGGLLIHAEPLGQLQAATALATAVGTARAWVRTTHFRAERRGGSRVMRFTFPGINKKTSFSFPVILKSCCYTPPLLSSEASHPEGKSEHLDTF